MALVKQTLKTGILNLLHSFQQQQNITGPQAEDLLADGLATLIDDYIKTGTVTTTGTAATQTGTIR